LSNLTDLKGKVAVVTGAGSGIGLGIARAFGREGMSVALLDIRPDTLDAAAESVRAAGGKTFEIAVDVSDREKLEQAAAAIEAQFGKIHVICNNAGVVIGGRTLDSVTPLEWQWVLDVNLGGCINGIAAFVPRIRKHGEGGHVVNTASIGGFEVHPVLKTGPYDVTKFGIVALSEALANDLEGTNVGVTIFAPGAFNTQIRQSVEFRQPRYGGPAAAPPPPTQRTGEPRLEPDVAGKRVVDAIRNNELYAFTHPEARKRVEPRLRRILQALDATDRWAAAQK
jgi:NAD(P)-dependent dehydrogenase (short-subunit alcohol dehydrogenase family)